MLNPRRLGRIMERRFHQGQRVARRMRRAEREMRRAARRMTRRRGCLGLFLF